MLKVKALLQKLANWHTAPFVLEDVISAQQQFTAGTPKSVDLVAPNKTGYNFITWINPRGLGFTGSFYFTVMAQAQGRMWAVPNITGTFKVVGTAVYIKKP